MNGYYNEFSDIEYFYTTNPKYPDFFIVRVKFLFCGRPIIKDLYIHLSSRINSNNYTNSVNFILDRELRDGTLQRYSNDYLNDDLRNNFSVYDKDYNDVTVGFLNNTFVFEDYDSKPSNTFVKQDTNQLPIAIKNEKEETSFLNSSNVDSSIKQQANPFADLSDNRKPQYENPFSKKQLPIQTDLSSPFPLKPSSKDDPFSNYQTNNKDYLPVKYDVNSNGVSKFSSKKTNRKSSRETWDSIKNFFVKHKKPIIITSVILGIGIIATSIAVPLSIKASSDIFTVTWKNYDGNVLEETKYKRWATPEFGKGIPSKKSTAEYTFKFRGWYPTIKAVTSDITYTAQYEDVKNKYDIKWFRDEAKTDCLLSKTYEYGSTAEYVGTTPKKSGYDFKGWKELNDKGIWVLVNNGNNFTVECGRELVAYFVIKNT